jgi:hypothetical protein
VENFDQQLIRAKNQQAPQNANECVAEPRSHSQPPSFYASAPQPEGKKGQPYSE